MNKTSIRKKRIRVAFRAHGMGVSPFVVKRSSLGISVFEPTNDELDQEHEKRGHRGESERR
jgi:hypothetical protein